MSAASDFLVETLSRIYSPRTGLNAWRWGEKFIKLGSRESIDFQGPWDSSLTPYVRFLMEFVTGDFSDNIEFLPGTPRDTEWEEFIVMKSSQLGFTLSLLIVLAYWIAEVKQNALLSLDSREEMQKVAKSRLIPLLMECEPTRTAMDEAEDEASNLTLFLNALVVYLLGSHSPGAFRNKSVGLAILDELDVYKITGAAGSDPLANARARLKAVGGGKLITTSSPETEEHPTAKEEKTGTQHRCFVPCPFCDHFQTLEFSGLRFAHCKATDGTYDLERVERETFYECELCHKAISEDHKPAMMARHRWRQTNPNPKPRKLSIQMGDFYSPFKKASWGRIAVEFLEAQGNPTKLAEFRKNRQGLPSRLQSDQRTPDQIDKLRKGYLRGTIPVEPALVAVLSDVQGDAKKWVKLGFRPLAPGSRDAAIWVIDWGATLSFEELSLIAADPVPIGRVPAQSDLQRWNAAVDKWEGPSATAPIGCIDEGNWSADVRDYCQRTQQGEGACRFFPTKGRGGIQIRLTVQESKTEARGEVLRVYHYSDDDIKKLLYIGRIARRVRPTPTLTPGPPLHFPSVLDPDFKRELCSEKLVIVRKDGFTKEEWQKDRSTPNDWGDALKLGLVLWHVCAPMFSDWLPENEAERAAFLAAASETPAAPTEEPQAAAA